jgi:prepilin-type N-terminal cleavage/methylation domain-containing protein
VKLRRSNAAYRRVIAGFTLAECLIGLSVLGIGLASTIGALTKMNGMAATSRNTTGAYQVLANQVDMFQSLSPFNPQKTNQNPDPCTGATNTVQVPKDNCHSSYPLYDMSVTAANTWRNLSVNGTDFSVPVYQYKDTSNNTVVVVNGQLAVQVTDLTSAGLTNTYQATFRIQYTYLNQQYTYYMSTVRTSDI